RFLVTARSAATERHAPPATILVAGVVAAHAERRAGWAAALVVVFATERQAQPTAFTLVAGFLVRGSAAWPHRQAGAAGAIVAGAGHDVVGICPRAIPAA